MKHTHPRIGTYALGFVLSITATLLAFISAAHFGTTAAYAAIILLALVQLFIQLRFFLHLGKKTAPEAYRPLLAFAAVIVGILVIGTLWIMHNLAHLHTESPTMQYMYQDGTAAPQNELR